MPELKRIQTTSSADISDRHSRSSASDLSSFGLTTFFRARDAAELGVDSRALRRLVDEGTVERLGRGLYRLAEAEPTEHYTLAAVCARVPGAIVCLLLGPERPRARHAASVAGVDRHPAQGPHARLPELPVRVVRFSGASLRYGIEDTAFEGVPARITSPARTVVDCFRFRRLVGKDVALEALRDALRDRRASVDQIWRAADVCRAKSLVGPVLDALTG